ncbi:MAG: DUF1822 family protein [Phormidesmis sp.]
MTADSVLFDLDTLYLEIDPRAQARAWQQSRSLSTPERQWNAYLNQLALDAFLSWLKAEGSIAKPSLAAPLLPTVWELVTGSAIDYLDSAGQNSAAQDRAGQNGPQASARLIVLPTEALDGDELRVPQTWIDIPNWAGDYYLSLQVNPDARWVRFAGFATHQALKSQGSYDWRDRTYSLEASDLTSDLSVLQVAQSLYPEAVKRTALPVLSPMPVAQAHQLIERLAADSVLEPRLAVGFEQWGPLLAHGGWRRQLAERRWGQRSVSISQWLRSGANQMADQLGDQINLLARQLGWQQMSYQPAIATARDAESPSAQSSTQPVLCRDLEIAGESYSLQVMPLSSAENAWRFELTKAAGQLLPGVMLKLLTEDLQPFENNQAIATEAVDSLYIDVAIAPQEGIVWQTQPAPSQYDPEILRF